jgi:uncharacterized membrane protein (DUF2068 family)
MGRCRGTGSKPGVTCPVTTCSAAVIIPTTVSARKHDIGFVLIAIFKLLKGALLFVMGIGALSLVHRDATEVVNHWTHLLQLNMQNRWIQNLAIKLGLVNRRELGLIAGTTFFYSALLLTEGVGLLLEKVWAEYLTFIITTSFIPIEVYELMRRVTVPRIVILAVNVLIAAYLAVRLQQREKAKRRS